MSLTASDGRLYVLRLQQSSRTLASRTLPFRGDAEAVAQAHAILTGLPQEPDQPVTIDVGRAQDAEQVQWLGVWGLRRGVAHWRVARRL